MKDDISTPMNEGGGQRLGAGGTHARKEWLAGQNEAAVDGTLQHRVRNLLAVVRSIARRTAERSETVEQMIGHLDGRLNAFSRVQSAVTRRMGGSRCTGSGGPIMVPGSFISTGSKRVSKAKPEPAREGFGHEMLLRTLLYDLRAETSIEFKEDGLRFTMGLPLGPDVLAE